MNRRQWLRSIFAATVTLTSIFVGAAALIGESPAAPPDPQILEHVLAVQNRHTDLLFGLGGVVGTATGLGPQGGYVVKVYVTHEQVANVVPRRLEGVPVSVEVTGPFEACKPPGGGGGGGNTIDPKSRFPRPVPIGVSTGNEFECSAGTIGCRLTDGVDVFALSNNHVYALENDAPVGSRVLQPGLYDTACVGSVADVIGTLYNFVPIVFSTSASNTVDAAVAASSIDNLGNSTPSNGYGTPSSSTVAAALNQPVQKYGRTTSLTRGVITGINATVNVGYSSGTARFVNQIVVGASSPFLKAGDSGSLLVTDPGKNPVGLLFAADRSGKTAIANRIGDVLAAFGLSIDGQ
jgi:hypothetical protein